MKKMLGAAFVAAILVMGGCSQPLNLEVPGAKAFGASEKSAEDRTVSGAQTVIDTTEPAIRLADGLWVWQESSSRYQPRAYAFWVDIQVKNLAFEKVVGIKWSNDRWATTNTAYAVLEANTAQGYERWGVDVKMAPGASTEIEYAVFATMNGTTTWDTKNNHVLGSMTSNVQFLGGKTEVKSGSAFFKGIVRVKNLAYEKKVNVVYTTDKWSTVKTIPAVYNSGNDWDFSIPLTLPNSIDLELAVSYTVAGQTYWDNNGNKNYQFPIGPHFNRETSLNSDWLGGRELLMVYDSNTNSNAVTTVTATVNGRTVEVQNNGVIKTVINVPEFAPAQTLNVVFNSEDSFGFKASRTYTFRANYDLEPKSVFGTDVLKWPYNLKFKNGKLYAADHEKAQVLIYNPVDASTEVIDTLVNGQDMDVDSQGRLVVLATFYGPRVDIYNSTGMVKSFSIPETTLRIPVGMELKDDVLYIGSYVEDKILKMDLDGNVLGSIPLGSFQKYKIIGDKIYLLSTYPVTQIEVMNLDGIQERVIPLYGDGYEEVSYPNDLAVGDDFIALIQNYKVVVLGTDGKVKSKWSGRDFDYVDYSLTTIPGRFGSVVTSIETAGRDIFVGDFGAHTIHRFTLK